MQACRWGRQAGCTRREVGAGFCGALHIAALRIATMTHHVPTRPYQPANTHVKPAACRPVFMSEAFKMRIATPAPEPAFPFGMGASAAAAAAAHAEWLDVLALASKHRYEDLFDKATDFLVEEVGCRAGVESAGVVAQGGRSDGAMPLPLLLLARRRHAVPAADEAV